MIFRSRFEPLQITCANPIAGSTYRVNIMGFVLLLAIFLTSSGYLFNASIPPSSPAAVASLPPLADAPAAGDLAVIPPPGP